MIKTTRRDRNLERSPADWLDRNRPGQGMTEYALVTIVLTTGFFVAGFEFFPAFIQAFQRYYDSFYVLINLPIP